MGGVQVVKVCSLVSAAPDGGQGLAQVEQCRCNSDAHLRMGEKGALELTRG